MSNGTSRERVSRVGALGFLERMIQPMFVAAEVVKAMQPRVMKSPTIEKGGASVTSALTLVDLMIEDRLGCDIATRFDDVSFWGEERASDHVSALIPDGQPYIATIDPVDGTLLYRNGSDRYQIILTLNTADGEMLGCLICRPVTEEAYIGVRHANGRYQAFHWKRAHHGAPAPTYTCKEIRCVDSHARIILLGEEDTDKAEKVRAAGYEPVFPWSDRYHREIASKQGVSPHESFGIVRGEIVGFLQRGSAGMLHIDSVAIGFLARCLGGYQSLGARNHERWTYTHHACAADKEAENLLASLI